MRKPCGRSRHKTHLLGCESSSRRAIGRHSLLCLAWSGPATLSIYCARAGAASPRAASPFLASASFFANCRSSPTSCAAHSSAPRCKFGEGKLHTRPRRPLRRPMSRSKLEADASIVTLLELPEVAMRLWPLSTNLNSEEEIVPVKLPSRNLNRGARAVSLR